MIPIRRIALALVLTFGFGASPTRAEFLATIDVVVSPGSGGPLRYEYSVAVDPASALPAVQLDLMVSADADLDSIEVPVGWSFDYDAAGGAISFFAEKADAPIAPGSSAVFAFTSPLAPGDMKFFLTGSNPPGFQVLQGTIKSPGTAIPEPASFILALSAIGIGLIGARRR